MKYNTITKQVAKRVPGGIYEGIDYHGTPPADVGARAGWVDVTPEIQAQLDAAAAQAAIDAAAAAQAEHDTSAPSGDLATWSKREKCLLLVTFKLAKEHWPQMTKEQFLDNLKAEWDAVQ